MPAPVTAALLCLAALALVLLVVPIHVEIAVERERALRVSLHLCWLFGLVRFRLHPRAARGERGPARERTKRRGRRRGARLGRRLAGAALRPDLRARSAVFLRELSTSLRPRDVSVRARIGMDDPADTGLLWAVLGPLSVLLPSRSVRLEPDFDGSCLQLWAAARIRVVPARVLFLSLAFLFSPPVVRALVAR